MAWLSSSLGKRRPMPSASTATPKGRPLAIRLSIEVSRTSTRRDSRTGSSRGNSSAISVRVAPADLPMPRARWPAERPMATTRYHRWVVMASVIRLLTSSTPTLLAVSKPKVGVPPGSGRSLSMVFGTCATRRLPPAASASRDAENAVSSPPIVTSASTPSLRSDSRQACRRQSGSAAPTSLTVGLAREVRMTEPPWTWIRDTSVMDSGRASSTRPPMRCWKPSMIPRTSHPEFRASIVAAAITEFIPGAGPPPHKIASFTPSSSQPRSDPGKRVLAAAAVGVLYLLKATEGNLILGGAAVALAGLLWLPVTRNWSPRAHLCWASSTYLFAVYLVYALEWTFASQLGPASTAGGVLLWCLEVVAALMSCAYLWELCDALGTARWHRRRAPLDPRLRVPTAALRAVGPTRDNPPPLVSVHVPAHNEPPAMVIDTLRALLRLDYPRV